MGSSGPGHELVIRDEEDPEGFADGVGQLEEVELVKQEVEVVDQDPAVLLSAVYDLEHLSKLCLPNLSLLNLFRPRQHRKASIFFFHNTQ